MNSSLQEFKNLTTTYNGVILYRPLADEVDYTDPVFPMDLPLDRIVLPTDKNENPFVWVDKCVGYFKKSRPYVLVPGTRFDIYGTRHGKGGGWYDRFLSEIPSTWLKIGVVDASKISFQEIARNSWDQTVDWILMCDDNEWNTYRANL